MAKRILSAIAITLFLSLANLGADAPLVTMDDAIRSSKESNISMEYVAAVLSKENRTQDNIASAFMPDISLNASARPSVSFDSSGAQYDEISVSTGADASFRFTGSMIDEARIRSLRKQRAAAVPRYWLSCPRLMQRDFSGGA